MQYLFAQHWDVIQGKEEEYSKFITETYMEQIKAVGFRPVGGYYVEIGSGPRIVGVNKVNTLSELTEALTNRQFREVTSGLKSLVINYSTAVLEPVDKFAEQEYSIQKGVWKLQISYDIKPGMTTTHYDVVANEHMPLLKKLNYVEVTGAWNVIIGGNSQAIAELTFKDPVDIGRFLSDEAHRKLTQKLRNELVLNYTNRILRCTERFDEPRWFRL